MNQNEKSTINITRKTAKFNGNGKSEQALAEMAYHKIVLSDMFTMRGSAKHLSWRC